MPFGRLLRAALALGLGVAAVMHSSPLRAAEPDSGASPDTAAGWDVSVFTVTDSHGELRPCRCPGLESGGLGLRATVFKRARSMQIPALILDGGDFVSDTEDSLQSARAALYVKGMERLAYDAVALGERDLSLGPEFLTDAAARLPLVCANLEGGERLGIPRDRRVERGGKTLMITAYLDPGILPENSPWRLGNPVETLTTLIASAERSVDFVVVIAHASTGPAEATIAQLPGVHVAVRGHAPEDGPHASSVGRVPLLLPSSRGRNVIQATLRLSALGTLRERSIRAWEIKQVEKGDARLDALVEEFEAAHGLEP